MSGQPGTALNGWVIAQQKKSCIPSQVGAARAQLTPQALGVAVAPQRKEALVAAVL